MKKFNSQKDYYEVLGVPLEATQDEIDRGYKNRARESHPDIGGSDEAMKSLNEAHEILGDPEARDAYDSERHANKQVIPVGSSVALDENSHNRGGTLEINLSNPDFAGLCIAAATCLGLGIPFLMLVEMQWMLFLWPLRILTIGVLVLGVLLAHSAMDIKKNKRTEREGNPSRRRLAVYEIVFWSAAALAGYLLYLLLYA